MESFIENTLFLDLEVTIEGRIHGLGALYGERKPLRSRNAQSVRETLPSLRQWAGSADYVCGHNSLAHDFPILEKTPFGTVPSSKALDTLLLSPLAFPKKPYHALVKNGKLVSAAQNDPIADSQCCANALADCANQFARGKSDDLSVYALAFDIAGLNGMARFIASCSEREGTLPIRSPLNGFEADTNRFLELFQNLNKERCCLNSLPEISNAEDVLVLAYIHSWLNVSGADSILPYWLCHRYTTIRPHLSRMRSQSCGDQNCDYCTAKHSPTKALKRFFEFDSFRPDPSVPGDPNRSLQEHIVSNAMEGKSVLAILPTGGGKSLCFQIPALHRYDCTGALSIVISPLQSLMRDQVSNLKSRAGILHCNALYGLLTPLERKACLEDIRMGSIGLLYVAPEQLRSTAFRNAIRNREIAFWIYDEAHCLSKWGHDFRPDYLYAATFIRELSQEQGLDCPQVLALTATAKKDVKQDILNHFKDEVGHELLLLDGGTERANLAYSVEKVNAPAKFSRIIEILTAYYGDEHSYEDRGSTVIFAATRKNVEEIAANLNLKGWEAAGYHAGLEADVKKTILDKFLNNQLKIIVSTNAFGMGVDKPDIRYVIHADAPGSLENYLQEAGRGGRDGERAECILLYDESDLELQHRFAAFSKITQKDIQIIWKSIRNAKMDKNGAIVLTVDEILSNKAASEISFDGDQASAAKTKTQSAVALLERQRFLERKENQSRVFQARSLVETVEEARHRIIELKLSLDATKLWIAVMKVFFDLPENACGDIYEFTGLDEMQAEFERVKKRDHRIKSINTVVFGTLNEMAKPKVGLLQNDLLFSAFVETGKQGSIRTLRELSNLEAQFLKLLQEHEPDSDGFCTLRLLKVNEALCREGIASHTDVLKWTAKTLQDDWRKIENDINGFEIKKDDRDSLQIELRKGWDEIVKLSLQRRDMAALIIKALVEKHIDAESSERRVLVSFSESELIEYICSDLSGNYRALRDFPEALHHVLLWMHDGKVINLQQGKALITSAMTLYLKDHRKGNRARLFTKGDYSPLAIYYVEKVLQVHIIGEYARKGIEEVGKHIAFIKEYFRLGGERFVKLYFDGRSEMLKLATGIESYKKIFESLKNAKQQAIVGASEQKNILILAGPGSGKTRVIAHRCAWLLRVNRVRSQGIVLLCFNRMATLQLRRRIWKLVGKDAAGVSIQTFHGLALRLLGRTMADIGTESEGTSLSFNELIPEANRMLKSDTIPIGMDADDFRQRLTGNLTHILVDEYQDITPEAYEMVSLIAGKSKESEEDKLKIMVVGDDDQSIYAFAGANIDFIKKYEADYADKSGRTSEFASQVARHYLVENYRSTANIIGASNRLIAKNRDRMKTDFPIQINESRVNDAAGGEYETLDTYAKGRVQVLKVADQLSQAEACISEIERLKSISPSIKWGEVCIFARNNKELTLIRLILERKNMPVCVLGENSMPNIRRAKEVHNWLSYLSLKRKEFWTGDQLLKELKACIGEDEMLRQRGRLLSLMASEYYGETGGVEQSVADILEHFHGVLAENKRVGSGDGIVLSTAHKAKGLEFDHVLILDNGWEPRVPTNRNMEEERRVYYVAMTRARKTLALLQRNDCTNRFVREVQEYTTFNRDIETQSSNKDLLGIQCRSILLDELWIDFAANIRPNDPKRRALHQTAEKNTLTFDVSETEQGTKRIELKDQYGISLARLSKRGVKNWLPHIDKIVRISVSGIHIRKSSDREDADKRRQPIRDEWEILICEVYYKAEMYSKPSN